MPAKKPAKKAAQPAREAAKAATAAAPVSATGSKAVDARIADLPAWQAETLTRLRRLIREAVPDVEEDVKWRKPSNNMAGVATWSKDGLLCTGEPYKAYVKLTFAHGAALPDPKKVFNAGFGGGTRRAIDLREGEDIDAAAFKALVKAAARLNAS